MLVFLFIGKAQSQTQLSHLEDSLIVVINSKIPDTMRVRLQLELANKFLEQGHLKAAHYFKLAIATTEKHVGRPDEEQLHIYRAKALKGLGNAYHVENRMEESLKNFQLLLEMQVEHGDSDDIDDTYFLINRIYQEMRNWKAAEPYGRKALYARLRQKDTIGIINCYISIGRNYLRMKEPQKAMVQFRSGLNHAEDVGYRYGAAKLHSSIGNVHRRLHRNDSAKWFYEESLRRFRRLNDEYEILHQQFNLGWIYADRGDRQKAILYADSALARSIASGIAGEDSRGYFSRSRIHKQLGNIQAAMADMEEGYRLRDSLNALIRQRQIAEMELQFAYKQEFLEDSIAHAEEINTQNLEQQNIRTLSVALSAGVFLLLALAYVLFRSNRSKTKSHLEISKEKERSDELLLNILPASVAAELKRLGKSKPRRYDSVTVMFTDFKDFTKVAANMRPEELVQEIDFCFLAFDRIIERHGIEKIKTIGDAYMAVSGVPVESDDHAERVIKAAFEIRDFMRDLKFKRDWEGKPAFGVRIGIHSGPIVAGIVGSKKFSYDIWGDTVNTAARVESHGEEGKVNVSADTVNLVRGKFHFRYRGAIEAKNKGEVEMYFVEPLNGEQVDPT